MRLSSLTNQHQNAYISPITENPYPPQTVREAEKRADALKEVLKVAAPALNPVETEVKYQKVDWIGYYYIKVKFPKKLDRKESDAMTTQILLRNENTGIKYIVHTGEKSDTYFCFFTVKDGKQFKPPR